MAFIHSSIAFGFFLLAFASGSGWWLAAGLGNLVAATAYQFGERDDA